MTSEIIISKRTSLIKQVGILYVLIRTMVKLEHGIRIECFEVRLSGSAYLTNAFFEPINVSFSKDLFHGVNIVASAPAFKPLETWSDIAHHKIVASSMCSYPLPT